MTAIPECHKEKFQSNKLAKEKTLSSGSEFMPNVGRNPDPDSSVFSFVDFSWQPAFGGRFSGIAAM